MEIKVNAEALRNAAKQISQNGASILDKRIVLPFARSEGELANELPNAVGALMTYGDSVAALLMHISETLTEAADRFEITDRSLTYEE